jgi:hypothetical protein
LPRAPILRSDLAYATVLGRGVEVEYSRGEDYVTFDLRGSVVLWIEQRRALACIYGARKLRGRRPLDDAELAAGLGDNRAIWAGVEVGDVDAQTLEIPRISGRWRHLGRALSFTYYRPDVRENREHKIEGDAVETWRMGDNDSGVVVVEGPTLEIVDINGQGWLEG